MAIACITSFETCEYKREDLLYLSEMLIKRWNRMVKVVVHSLNQLMICLRRTWIILETAPIDSETCAKTV